MSGAWCDYDLSFRNPKKPYMARGDFMWGGTVVVVSPMVDAEHYADEVRPLPEHGLVRFIRRLLGSAQRPWVYARGDKMEREQAYMVGDKLFVSPRGWEALKAGAHRGRTEQENE